MILEDFEKSVIDSLKIKLTTKVERELAKESEVSRGYINALKNRKKPPRSLTVETLLKLFPHATIHLNGDTISGTATSTNGIAVVGNHFSGSVAHPECKEKLDAISGAVLDADIPDDAKIKVLKIIKEVR